MGLGLLIAISLGGYRLRKGRQSWEMADHIVDGIGSYQGLLSQRLAIVADQTCNSENGFSMPSSLIK
jgi:hypothetical protein